MYWILSLSYLILSKCPIKIENDIQYSSKIDSSNILEACRISKTNLVVNNLKSFNYETFHHDAE